jgi:hypothetical protein
MMAPANNWNYSAYEPDTSDLRKEFHPDLSIQGRQFFKRRFEAAGQPGDNEAQTHHHSIE